MWITTSTAVAHLNLSVIDYLSSVYKLDSWFRLIQHIVVDSREFFLMDWPDLFSGLMGLSLFV